MSAENANKLMVIDYKIYNGNTWQYLTVLDEFLEATVVAKVVLVDVDGVTMPAAELTVGRLEPRRLVS